MKKILLFIATWGLVTTGVNMGDRADAHAGNSNSPHVDSKFEFPHSRWATVRQTIQVHVPPGSQVLTELWINVPQNFEFPTAKIEITAGDRSISAPISRQGQWLQINFDSPIVSDRTLRIDLNSVNRNMLMRSPVYYVYSKSGDGSTNFIGEAYFPRTD